MIAATSPLLPLELNLWHPTTFTTRALMDATFALDVREFGRSGRRYTRAWLLATEPRGFQASLHDFTEHPLSDTLALTPQFSDLRPQRP